MTEFSLYFFFDYILDGRRIQKELVLSGEVSEHGYRLSEVPKIAMNIAMPRRMVGGITREILFAALSYFYLGRRYC